MPAPSAFLITQAAVFATSVLLLQMNWGASDKEVRKPQPVPRSTGPAAMPQVAAALPAPPTEALTAANSKPAEKLPELVAEEPPPAIPLEDPFPKPDHTLTGAYDIAADAASNFDLKNDRVVFTGNVSLKSKRFIVMADRLTVSIDPKKNAMRRLQANGNVRVEVISEDQKGGYTGQSWEATFDPSTDIITLTGWPRIQGDGREHRALEPTTKMLLTTVNPKLTTQGRASTFIAGQKKSLAQVKP